MKSLFQFYMLVVLGAVSMSHVAAIPSDNDEDQGALFFDFEAEGAGVAQAFERPSDIEKVAAELPEDQRALFREQVRALDNPQDLDNLGVLKTLKDIDESQRGVFVENVRSLGDLFEVDASFLVDALMKIPEGQRLFFARELQALEGKKEQFNELFRQAHQLIDEHTSEAGIRSLVEIVQQRDPFLLLSGTFRALKGAGDDVFHSYASSLRAWGDAKNMFMKNFLQGYVHAFEKEEMFELGAVVNEAHDVTLYFQWKYFQDYGMAAKHAAVDAAMDVAVEDAEVAAVEVVLGQRGRDEQDAVEVSSRLKQKTKPSFRNLWPPTDEVLSIYTSPIQNIVFLENAPSISAPEDVEINAEILDTYYNHTDHAAMPPFHPVPVAVVNPFEGLLELNEINIDDDFDLFDGESDHEDLDGEVLNDEGWLAPAQLMALGGVAQNPPAELEGPEFEVEIDLGEGDEVAPAGG